LVSSEPTFLKQDIINYLFDDVENFKFIVGSKRMNIEVLKDILDVDE